MVRRVAGRRKPPLRASTLGESEAARARDDDRRRIETRDGATWRCCDLVSGVNVVLRSLQRDFAFSCGPLTYLLLTPFVRYGYSSPKYTCRIEVDKIQKCGEHNKQLAAKLKAAYDAEHKELQPQMQRAEDKFQKCAEQNKQLKAELKAAYANLREANAELKKFKANGRNFSTLVDGISSELQGISSELQGIANQCILCYRSVNLAQLKLMHSTEALFFDVNLCKWHTPLCNMIPYINTIHDLHGALQQKQEYYAKK